MTTLSSEFLEKPKYFKEFFLSSGEKLFAADPKATRALLALMDMSAVMGGAAAHWGGPSAFAEINSVLFAFMFRKSKKWFDHFHFINDAGHCENGLYALKANYNYAGLKIEDLKKFRSLTSFLTGHGEHHLFPKGVYLSNGPLSSTIAQAQGLSIADRMSKKNRTTILMVSDGALMEGEAREALASIPGFSKKNLMNPFLMIVSNNNTKLSGRIDEDSFSMKPTLSSLENLGWTVLTLKESHHLTKTAHLMEKALLQTKTKSPVAVLAQTIKGYGVQKTQTSSSGGHGFPLKNPHELKSFLEEIYQEEKIPEEFIKWSEELIQNVSKKTISAKKIPEEKVQEGISKALIKKKEQGCPLVSVTSDLPGSTGVMGFRKKFPKDSFDVGVAEANMFSLASGLSKEGFIPIVDTFAQFGVSKGSLPLFMAVLSKAPVIAVLSHTGFQDAADGASHQCLTYFAQTGSIPNTFIYTLSSSEEAEALMEQTIERFQKERSNFIFFLGREKHPPSYYDKPYELGKSQVVFSKISKQKKSCTLIASGTLLREALQAAKELVQQNWDIILIHPSIINNPDVETIETCLSQTQGHILTIEDHQIKGGMGSFIAHALCLKKIPFQMHSLGVQGKFGRSAYQALDLYRLHGLDHASIVQAVKSHF